MQIKKNLPYLAIISLLIFIAFDKCNCSAKLTKAITSVSDFPDCGHRLVTIYESEIQNVVIDVPLTYEISQDAFIRAPEMNKAQKLWREAECSLDRNVPFFAMGRITNTGSEKGLFIARIRVEMDNGTRSEEFTIRKELAPDEDGLFTSREFDARCTPEPMITNIFIEAPIVKKQRQESVKVPKNIEARVLIVKKERRNIMLRNHPSFDRSSETELRVNGGDLLIYLDEKAEKMTWTTETGEYLKGNFLKIRTLNEPDPKWVFSTFVDCK